MSALSWLIAKLVWVIRNEPARLITWVQLGLVLAVSLGVLRLTSTQIAAIMAFAGAVLLPGGEAIRSQVSPVNR